MVIECMDSIALTSRIRNVMPLSFSNQAHEVLARVAVRDKKTMGIMIEGVV